MNETEVTTDGLKHVRSGREALTGVHTGPGGDGQPPTARRARRRGGRGEQPMVPDAEFRSYYGEPIVNQPVWEASDIAGYLFLGGLAGAGSVVAAAAQLTGRPRLARTGKLGSAVAISLSLAALVHDLGRPGRFLNMLRTLKPTSPMSVGSWLLSAYGPAALAAAASEVTGALPGIGTLATAGAAIVGPAIATYTAALVSNTAVPAWHDGHRDMPFVFAASAVSAAAGLGILGAPVDECRPVRALAAVGGTAELVAQQVMLKRMGLAAEAFREPPARRLHRLSISVVAAGVVGSLLGRRSRVVSALAGGALLAGSALTRFAIFEAGMVSAKDPRYTVVPQRQRRAARDNTAS